MTPERQARIETALRQRQPDLTVVLENVFDAHNISAVMRTCDSVGIQDIYVLNTMESRRKTWNVRSASSADRWLTIHEFTDFQPCLQQLQRGFQQILTTDLSAEAVNLYDIDFSIPTALVFGNEQEGVTAEFHAHATGNFLVPQYGMIKSLNISVACAVAVYEASRQKRAAGHYHQQKLDPICYENIRKDWMDPVRKVEKKAAKLEKRKKNPLKSRN